MRRAPAWMAGALAIALTACGRHDLPTAELLDLAVQADGSLRGRVRIPGEPAVTSFQVLRTTTSGTLDLDGATGSFSYRPADEFVGRDSFLIAAQTASIVPLAAVAYLEVTAADHPPVLADQSVQVAEDSTLVGRAIVTATRAPVLTFAVADHPSNGRVDLDSTTGAFTYWPNQDFNGADAFTVVASNGQAVSAPAMVSVTVLPVDDAPVSNSASVVLLEDSQADGRITAGDLDSTSVTFALLVAPQHGTLDLDPLTGVFSYRPVPDYEGTDSFQFVTNDGELDSAPATVTFTIVPVNDSPVALAQTVTLFEDGVGTGLVMATDVDSPVLTYAVVVPPANGTLSLDGATGAFTYRPDPDYGGMDSFQFVANDGELTSAPAIVTLLVQPVNDPPVAQDQAMTLDEDTVGLGNVLATDVDSTALSYAVTAQPAHGTVQLDPATGAFSYRPAKDYNGTDTFRFTAWDGELTSAPATVTLTVVPVNDPPELPVIPDQTNSPETRDTFVALPLRDVDGDLLQYAVVVEDPAVATARVDDTATLILTPRTRGDTTVTLSASDGVFQTATSFKFTATDVSKLRRYDVADTRAQAISILNRSSSDVTFELRHNGALLATTGAQLVQEVQSLPDEGPPEPFERKLWRFIRDGSYHFDPMTGATWQHDPLLFLNSIGFGFCDDAMAVYVSLAERAGYTARGWDLTGHAVPEVQVGGRWAMYDPDVAVYYLDALGAVAGVAQLEEDPGLVSNPYARVSSDAVPYGDYVRTLYATAADNRVMDAEFFVSPRDTDALVLPAGSRLTYPGQWATAPVGVWGTPVSVTAQLRLDLPAGFSGLVDWPLVPWDVRGSGRVRIAGVEYQAGTSELTALLQAVTAPRDAAQGRPVEIVEASGPLAIVYLLNPMRFSMTPTTEVAVRSLDAWALELAEVSQDATAQVEYWDVTAVERAR